MPLQNRVTPFGCIIAALARGTLMGNRGCLHDPHRRLVRTIRAGYRAWVTCRLEFKGRRRAVMTPGRYTELFFLDEPTALAAGHRPCAECRREDYLRFKGAWLRGNPERGLAARTPIGPIDRMLHADRLSPRGVQRTFRAALRALPDGVFVTSRERPDEALLTWRGRLLPWGPAGYGPPRPCPDGPEWQDVTVLTPRSTVGALRAGYEPTVHASAAEHPP